jgi:hypothetical protein
LGGETLESGGPAAMAAQLVEVSAGEGAEEAEGEEEGGVAATSSAAQRRSQRGGRGQLASVVSATTRKRKGA